MFVTRGVLGAILITCAGSKAAFAQMDLPKLQELSRTAVAQRWVSVEPPSISIQGRTLEYYLGGVSFFLPEQFGDPLLGAVVSEELRVQALRNVRRNPLGQQFWNNVLPQVESIVSQQLVVYQSDRPREQCEMEIGGLTEQIWQTYDTAFKDEAQRRGLQASPVAAAQGPRSVTITTAPPGGKVFLMHVLEAQLAAVMNRPPKWLEADESGSFNVDGQYWYSIQRDGVSSTPKRIDFNADENRTEYVLRD
ncbi:MAG TPA: hypothetical protein VG713_22435 [Pirellulales bacterium]|nr:hypothetical protein [Pirellulales bacterium]